MTSTPSGSDLGSRSGTGTAGGSAPPWRIRAHAGSASAFHRREVDAGEGRSAWWFTVDAPALVLGSAQRSETVDEAACRAAGIEIVRRRSGGGAVLMLPGEVLWLDVIVPRDDPLWDDDVGRSMWWFGEAWAAALRSLGVEASVHRGAMRHTGWSSVVCFDGIGAGEVCVGAAKAVGISQRRTRDHARMQSAVHLRWRPETLVALLATPRPEVGELRQVWSAPSRTPHALRAAVEASLPS